MTRLALLAVLLLALVPSLGRMLPAAAPQWPQAASELCTSTGLKWVAVDVGLFSGTPAPQPSMPAGGDHCDYCPLAASLSLLVPPLALLAPSPLRGTAPAWVAPRLRTPANLRGLGGQGPPLPL